MGLPIYEASVTMFTRMLNNLLSQMGKAEEYATAKKFDSVVFCQSRLAPDMLPFTKQVQIACDTAKLSVARLAGDEFTVRIETLCFPLNPLLLEFLPVAADPHAAEV